MTTYLQRYLINSFWIHIACPSILPCVKIMDKFHKPEIGSISSPYICAKSFDLKAGTYAWIQSPSGIGQPYQPREFPS